MNVKTMNPVRGITPTTMFCMEFKEGLFIACIPIGEKETPAMRGKSLFVKALLNMKTPFHIVYFRYNEMDHALAMVTPVGQAANRKQVPMGERTTCLDYVKDICRHYKIKTNEVKSFKVITNNYQETMF